MKEEGGEGREGGSERIIQMSRGYLGARRSAFHLAAPAGRRTTKLTQQHILVEVKSGFHHCQGMTCGGQKQKQHVPTCPHL